MVTSEIDNEGGTERPLRAMCSPKTIAEEIVVGTKMSPWIVELKLWEVLTFCYELGGVLL